MRFLILLVILILILSVGVAQALEMPQLEWQAAYIHNLHTGSTAVRPVVGTPVGSYKGVEAKIQMVLPLDLNDPDIGIGAGVAMPSMPRLELSAGFLDWGRDPYVGISWRLN